MGQNHYHGIFTLTWHFFQATPRTEQVGIWGKTTNMAFCTNMAFFQATSHAQSRWGYGPKPLTLHFSLTWHFFQATPRTEQVGIWGKTTTMAFLR